MMSLRMRYMETTEMRRVEAGGEDQAARSRCRGWRRVSSSTIFWKYAGHAHGAVVLQEHEGKPDGERNPVLAKVRKERSQVGDSSAGGLLPAHG